MLTDVKNKIADSSITDLLSYATTSDPVVLAKVVNRYKTYDHFELYGYVTEGEIIGIIGFVIDQVKRLEIKHIAVDPEVRGKGYGRGLILEVIEIKKPAMIEAETDEDAVEFYRHLGFTIVSLGDKYPGVERFQCIYDVHSVEEI